MVMIQWEMMVEAVEVEMSPVNKELQLNTRNGTAHR